MEFRLFTTLLFAVLLNTQIHCQVVPGSDPNMNCNSCCQGLAGINGIPGPAGIPGSNGHNGSPGRDGRDGLKGESGNKGDKGEIGVGQIGLPGPSGPSGDRGDSGLRGLPGKVGPRGPIGLVGPAGRVGQIGPVGPIGPPGLIGAAGIKGDKGSSGIKGDSGQISESAFTVYKTSAQTAAADGEIITFDAARVNIGGHFDLNTNRFTCQVAGTYVFSYSVHLSGINNPDIILVKDGINIANARGETVKIQVSNSVVLEMEVGNQVWLKFANSGEGVLGDAWGAYLNMFSGFLLYEH
ncbi:uncharacterized protein [Amphiura filiformis]|uniref:uncharacterized protein n=1 Tax=Amphiura filiformis TaxID=82378 RepID=UPI003B210900